MTTRGHHPAVLLPVLVCVFLGLAAAITSSVVAVLLPDSGHHGSRDSSRHDLANGQSVYVFASRKAGYTLWSVTGPMESSVADALDELRSRKIPLRQGDPRPAWLRRAVVLQGDPETAALAPQNSRGIAAGWPLLCLRGRTDRNVNLRPQSHDAGIAWVTVGQAKRAFPWHPLWWGLLGNTVVYGSAMLSCWYASVYAFRAIRRWRGRCPACGYPTDGNSSRCPECGTPRRASDQATGTGSSASATVACSSSLQTTSTLTSKSSSSDDR